MRKIQDLIFVSMLFAAAVFIGMGWYEVRQRHLEMGRLVSMWSSPSSSKHYKNDTFDDRWSATSPFKKDPFNDRWFFIHPKPPMKTETEIVAPRREFRI